MKWSKVWKGIWRETFTHTELLRCPSQNEMWIRENHCRVSKGNQYPIGWSNTNWEPDFKEGDEVTENEKRERGRRKGWMKGNCIRKKRRPEGRKWLEEKRLIADREGVGEMDRERERGWGVHLLLHSIHTDTPSVSIQSVCVSSKHTIKVTWLY